MAGDAKAFQPLPRKGPSDAKHALADLTTKVGVVGRKIGNKLERREVQRPPRMMLGTRG